VGIVIDIEIDFSFHQPCFGALISRHADLGTARIDMPFLPPPRGCPMFSFQMSSIVEDFVHLFFCSFFLEQIEVARRIQMMCVTRIR